MRDVLVMDGLHFAPDVLVKAPVDGNRAGCVHVSKSEIHLGVIFNGKFADLDIASGDLIAGNSYGSEDWSCGAWEIQRRTPDEMTEVLYRFEAKAAKR